jgi:hypothetical protein
MRRARTQPRRSRANGVPIGNVGEAGAPELRDAATHLRTRCAVSRGVVVVSLAVALASCGGSEDSRSASGSTRPRPTKHRSGAPPPRSPDAGIPVGHAAADARARRCRAAHPPRWHYWRYCDKYAR